MTTRTYETLDILQRMVNAVESVRVRLVRATQALAKHNVPYAVVGGNAVAAWVASVDEEAVRNTRDVDVMINRSDFRAAKQALESEGFIHRKVAGMDLFLDDAKAKPRTAVHVIFSGEFVRAGEPLPNPGVEQSTQLGGFRVLNLDALVRIKLTAFRDKDRTHVRDLIEVGLVDQSWTDKLPAALAARLQSLLDTPEG
ncbi:MAG: nucleotidyltransferase family protein [Phycisphaerales bacterium]|nr:nucleotidyltransferase family protein [Phycisphaerales bacterium]